MEIQLLKCHSTLVQSAIKLVLRTTCSKLFFRSSFM